MNAAITETLPAPAVSPFPAVFQDIGLIIDEDVAPKSSWMWSATATALLDAVRLFDVHTGPQIGDGRKSAATSAAS